MLDLPSGATENTRVPLFSPLPFRNWRTRSVHAKSPLPGETTAALSAHPWSPCFPAAVTQFGKVPLRGAITPCAAEPAQTRVGNSPLTATNTGSTVTPSRSGCTVCGAQCKMTTQSPLIRSYYKFQYSSE